MVSRTSDWRDELGRWLKPFLDRLGHQARRQMCPLYVSGLIGPGDRKSVQPMAKRLALGACDQLHHFIAAGVCIYRLSGTRFVWKRNSAYHGPEEVHHDLGQYPDYPKSQCTVEPGFPLLLYRGESPV